MQDGTRTPGGEVDTQRDLLPELMNPAAYPHPVGEIRLVETHISYVLLTGEFAYKIKKAVNLGFLDFTRLEQRRFFCDEELRLNSRLAPGLYLSVVPIGTSPEGLRVASTAPVVDYAVKMREFPQSALLDQCLAENRLMPAQVDQLADRVAGFHTQLAPTAAGDNYGSPESVWRPVEQTIDRLRKGLVAAQCRDAELTMLDELETWSRQQYARLEPALAVRKQAGFVRECHGDMHLGNIVWLDDQPLVFDGIEFNPAMRWIDVMNDVAFLVMDLEERGQAGYAHRFLNRYLETTGDYEGLRFLPFYRNYRALVRAMVACLRAAQEGVAAGEPEMSACAQYLAYAQRASSSKMPWLLLMHGLSGSGKTTVSQHILERTGALRVRSDIERKRLSGLPALARGSAVVDGGIYDEETTRATYLRLVQLARQVLEAGFPVVVDAASLKSWQRDAFRSLSQEQNVPFRLICCRADESTLQQRLRDREQKGSDASDANIDVLLHQRQSADPLTNKEQVKAGWVTEDDDTLDSLLHQIENEMGK